jgi:hypothetical protein
VHSDRARRRLAFALAAGALAVALTGAAAKASATTPLCSAHQLSAVYVDASGAAGSVDVEYGFENTSTHRCEISGYPGVQMLKASGQKLATDEQLATGAYGITVKPVLLAHKAVAYFGVHYAAQTGYGNLKCPTSVAVKLSPPGTSVGLLLHGQGGKIQAYGGSIPHLQCGILHVSALSAKRFQ